MFDLVLENLPQLANGFALTFMITLFGIFVGLALGIFLAIGEMYGGKVVSTVLRFYVEFFRGSPIIVQLFIFQYALPELTQIPISPYVTGFSVFALNSAAYQKGYIKGAMESVFEDQMIAGLSTGMSKWQTIRHVILPQTLRIMIPAWSNEFCSLTKSTAALAWIGFSDLTGVGRRIAVRTYRVLDTWIVIGIIYLIWITVFSKIADIIYEKKKIPGIELSL